ncbi:hypothetical protein V8G54_002586 [Vigna mungo]|uniref:Uncharacterized protein n=1 Tax=Vigna mungo TaxID=3915 RepID=A0AAQ3PAM6_VIGMU
MVSTPFPRGLVHPFHELIHLTSFIDRYTSHHSFTGLVDLIHEVWYALCEVSTSHIIRSGLVHPPRGLYTSFPLKHGFGPAFQAQSRLAPLVFCEFRPSARQWKSVFCCEETNWFWQARTRQVLGRAEARLDLAGGTAEAKDLREDSKGGGTDFSLEQNNASRTKGAVRATFGTTLREEKETHRISKVGIGNRVFKR